MEAGSIDRADRPRSDGPAVGRTTRGRRLRVSILAPAAAAFEGEATSVVAPAHDGEVGILAGHAPMVVLLGAGELRVTSDEGVSRFRVSTGFLQVVDDEVSVLAEQVERL